MTGVEVVGKCAICDDRFKVRSNGRIHHHKKRGEPCEGVNWPPGALACLLPPLPRKLTSPNRPTAQPPDRRFASVGRGVPGSGVGLVT